MPKLDQLFCTIAGDIANNVVNQRGDFPHISQKDAFQNAMAMAGGNLLTSHSLNENIPLRNQLQMEVGPLKSSHDGMSISQMRQQKRMKRVSTSIYQQGAQKPMISNSSAETSAPAPAST